MGAIIDKHRMLASLATRTPLILELGCGPRKHRPDAIGIDARDLESVDVVGDAFEVLAAIPSGVVDEVYSSHFVEHLPDIGRLLHELRRVLKVGGHVTTIAPHFSNPYFYSDYTHRSTFGLYSFSYLASDTIYRRKVPQYVDDIGFELLGVRLIFKASRPFYLRYAFRKAIELLVNSSIFLQEWYEDGWCYWFPCYEVKYRVVKRR